MVRYDSAIIYRFARYLETRARLVIWLAVCAGGLLGMIISWGMQAQQMNTVQPWFGFILGGAAGFILGSDIATRIRLQLHLMLCQVQIEENTRAAAQMVQEDREWPLVPR
jgi:hypothetical protein